AQARPIARSAVPPQRSITVSPSRVTQTEAPTSRRSAKLRSNSSRTAPNRGSHTVPSSLIPRANHVCGAPASASTLGSSSGPLSREGEQAAREHRNAEAVREGERSLADAQRRRRTERRERH